LAKVGELNQKYGYALKGSRGLGTFTWGAITQVGSSVYVHVLSPETDKILLPAKLKAVKSQGVVVGKNARIETIATKAGLILLGVRKWDVIKLDTLEGK